MEISNLFPQISQRVLYGVVIDKLVYHKFCACCMLKFLTDDQKNKKQNKRMDAALTFLLRYDTEGDNFLNYNVTSDAT